jgi:hypothetical protein
MLGSGATHAARRATVKKIVIICHPSGYFSVWKEPGTGHGSPILKTRQEADARAKQLQDEVGGPEKATIVVSDLTTAA